MTRSIFLIRKCPKAMYRFSNLIDLARVQSSENYKKPPLQANRAFKYIMQNYVMQSYIQYAQHYCIFRRASDGQDKNE